VYVDGEIKEASEDLNLTRTWFPASNFANERYDCGIIWSMGKTLDDCCPEDLKPYWLALNKKASAFLNSFQKSKINLQDICFYDLMPDWFLLEFFEVKNQITEHVFKEEKKPENHDFLYDLIIFLKVLEKQKLNIDLHNLDMSESAVRKVVQKIKSSPPFISYNAFGTVTGRLTTNKNSFPILTLNKSLRRAIKPTNDCFIELDYNAAEIRVLFYLLGQDQPAEDIHQWISENIFAGKYTREQAKKKVFAWLYNPQAKNKKLNQFLDRDRLYEKYYLNNAVHTPFGRNIDVGRDKAVNYLVQSTASDMFLHSAMKINKILSDRKSTVSFCVHDSLVLDYSLEDRPLVEEILQQFGDTKLGKIKTNLRIGKNFGVMREVK
tara:strand:+ start:3089 stop:4225 length:1137 start_codon:yes stop_codon:yes gene_type:complete